MSPYSPLDRGQIGQGITSVKADNTDSSGQIYTHLATATPLLGIGIGNALGDADRIRLHPAPLNDTWARFPDGKPPRFKPTKEQLMLLVESYNRNK